MTYRAEDFIHITPARGPLGSIVPNSWVLDHPVSVTRHGVHAFTVPAGFKTDLASVPRPFWLITNGKTGRHQRGSVAHDWLCTTKIMSAKEAAKVFLDIMIQDGVPKWRAKSMYRAVLWFRPRFDGPDVSL